MRSVQGWDAWSLQRVALGVSAEELRTARRDGSRPFFFGDARTLGVGIRNIIGTEGESAVLTEAENILAGKLPFFGQLRFDCEFPPPWFRNPVTGQSVSPEQPWTQMRFASPAYGDLKFILEPSRFLFVYPLIRAYALTGDERFPQAFWNSIEDWMRQSPPMAGPLWICGQECSLRILALSFALHGFIHSEATTSERVGRLVSMIAAHAWRTAQTLSYARSQRSNHLISEAAGLWTAGTLYPELREALVWRNLGEHLLREAVLDQITPEGASQQHSFNYQRMILHLLLWTLRLAEIHGSPLPEVIRERTQAGLDFLRPWVDSSSGLAPNYGSDDGSLILPLASAHYRDFRPFLHLGAAILGLPALQPGPWDEAALWLGVEPAAFDINLVKRDASPSLYCIETKVETGYFRLGDRNSWAMIRAGRYARRPFQADQLHVDLWWKGFNLARDPGTYLYNGSAPWNNAFAGTAVHNTVIVDGQDQMRRVGRFLWADWAQACGRLSTSQGSGSADRFEGQHDGYKRLGIVHRRVVQWLANVGWAIVDEIDGEGEHDLRVHWLAADLPYEVSDSPFQVAFVLGQDRIRWNIFSSAPNRAAVIRSGKQAWTNQLLNHEPIAYDMHLLGWESPTYGDLQPAVSLVCQTRSDLPVRFVTVILTDDQCRVEPRGDRLAVVRAQRDSPQESEIYAVNLSANEPSSAAIEASSTKAQR
jgi:asparagine synthase (glutamine-hydrolysing)